MTFLEIARQSAIQCGVAATQAINTALPSVVGAQGSGSVGRIIGWVNDAWTDIQMDHDDWDWMRSSNILGQGVSFQTVNGQASYPLGTGPGTVGVGVEQNLVPAQRVSDPAYRSSFPGFQLLDRFVEPEN